MSSVKWNKINMVVLVEASDEMKAKGNLCMECKD